MPHARPSRYCCASCGGAGAWPSASRICSPRSESAIIGSEINSTAHSPTRSDTPDLMRLARAKGLRGQGRDGRDQPHAEGEADEEDGVRQRRRSHGLAAEAPDQGDVGRHHRDLPELRQRDRHGKFQRLGEFERRDDGSGDRSCRRRERRKSILSRFDFFERSHGVRLTPSRAEKVTVGLRPIGRLAPAPG